MIRSFLLTVFLLSGCTVPYSYDCTELESYSVSTDTSTAPITFSWEGIGAKNLVVTGTDESILWEVGHDSYVGVRKSDEINLLESPVSFGNLAEGIEDLIEISPAVELTSGEVNTVTVTWGCMDPENSENEYQEIEHSTEFTVPQLIPSLTAKAYHSWQGFLYQMDSSDTPTYSMF